MSVVSAAYRAGVVFVGTLAAQTAGPRISQGGVVGAGLSKPAVVRFSPNSIVSIFGENFAPAGVRHQVGPADLVGGKVPTRLGGVCVQFGPDLAPVLYVDQGQINIVTPSIAEGGNVPVQVILNCMSSNEVKSNIETVATRSASPEFFYFSRNDFGRFPVAAINATTGMFVGPPDLVRGVPFVPAQPGDLLTLFGTGFGRTNPFFGPGELPGHPAPVVEPVKVTVGGIELPKDDVLYAGLSPGLAGVYQLNVRLGANIPDGVLPVGLLVGGFAAPDIGFLTVNRGGAGGARQAQVSKFLGSWLNEDSLTGGITRMTVRVDKDFMFIRMWGKCTPTDCDWGESRTDTADAGDGVLAPRWAFSYKQEAQEISALPDGRLRVTGSAHFTDNSGRTDYTYTAYFLRLPALTIARKAVAGGNSTAGTITLSEPAPSGGVVVSLQSDNAVAVVPASVTVPAGQTAWNFTITTRVATSVQIATITATIGDVRKVAALTVTVPLRAPTQLSPPDGSVFDHYPRTTTLKWEPVQGAVKYGWEVDYSWGVWCSETPGCRHSSGSVEATSHTFNFVGAQPGRWRVWGVDANGSNGLKSGWWGFRYTR